MRKLFAFIAVCGMLSFSNSLMAQDPEVAPEATTTEVAPEAAAPAPEAAPAAAPETAAPAPAAPAPAPAPAAATAPAAPAAPGSLAPASEDVIESTSLHTAIKTKFIEGGANFMAAVAASLIVGLAFSVERVIYLNLSDTNTSKLLAKIKEALDEGGIEEAKEYCRNARGPVASIFYQGLLRYDQGIEMVEKSVVSYGSVQMGQLEKGLTWISLCIGLAPMLGFMGTVIGMIGAFDSIQAAGDMSPALVAGGIKVALITTVAGLIVAMILQIFFNYCTAKIEGIVNNMEDASVTLLDYLVEFNNKNKK